MYEIVRGGKRFGLQPFLLTSEELPCIEGLVSELRSSFNTIESEQFASECEVAASELPRRLRAHLSQIRSGQFRGGFFQISGFIVDDNCLGPSPVHWDVAWFEQPYLREEIYQCLISSAIGGLIGWRTRENGRFLQHVVPIESDKYEQLGGSSATPLLLHTEDAFHPARADHFTLMCYRNNEAAVTYLAVVDELELDADTIAVLRQSRFLIEPDKSHLPKNNVSGHLMPDHNRYDRVKALIENPEPCALIYGSSSRPMMRVDQPFTRVAEGDDEAQRALTLLHNEMERKSHAVILKSGDLLIVDNLTAAHGRSVYKPDYGPKHRWLRRVNIRNGRRAHDEFLEPGSLSVMV
jgi:Fe(II)/alpha-ketoglutarate-dependent arginine beta-hydroxylase